MKTVRKRDATAKYNFHLSSIGEEEEEVTEDCSVVVFWGENSSLPMVSCIFNEMKV